MLHESTSAHRSRASKIEFHLKLRLFNIFLRFFFPVKTEMLLFPNLKPRRPPGGLPKLYFDLKILHFFENLKNFKISYQNRVSGSLLDASWVADLKKATSQLSLEKNYLIIFFWTEFKFVNSKTTEKRRF